VHLSAVRAKRSIERSTRRSAEREARVSIGLVVGSGGEEVVGSRMGAVNGGEAFWGEAEGSEWTEASGVGHGATLLLCASFRMLCETVAVKTLLSSCPLSRYVSWGASGTALDGVIIVSSLEIR
jgi:hypothetical protein